jgi:hypothetical protein
MSVLRLSDLHEAYRDSSHEEAISMANLGAICWQSCQAGMHKHWSASMAGDDTAKAELWRQEGRQMMLESVKAKLVIADKLQEDLVLSDAAREADRARAEQRLRHETDLLKKELCDIQQQHCQALDAEVARRLADAVRLAEERKDQEAASLRLRIATLTEEANMSAIVDSSRDKKVVSLELQLAAQLELVEEMKRTTEKEVMDRVQEAKSHQQVALEIQKAAEISDLRLRVAELSSQGELLAAKEEARKLLDEKVKTLESEAIKLQKQLATLQADATKSSYALGKAGEALIFDIITEYVLPVFMYSSAKDMSGISHVADIHLFLQSPVGKRMKILIDAKKYKDPVRGKEITKLHSDVDSDDDAMAGIMISTTSQISSVKQFQIEKTPNGKYVLYLSVEGFDDELRGKAICWAIRVLSTLASYADDSDENIMGKIAEFFKELDLSLKEADGLVKMCQKTLDSATVMKRNLGQRLESFRVEHLGSMVVESREPEPVAASTRGSKKKNAVVDLTPSPDDVISHEGETLTPMQRYYNANRDTILAKQKAARENKKKDGKPA